MQEEFQYDSNGPDWRLIRSVSVGGRVKFKVLGSLVVESDTGPLEVAGKRRRALLLRLLVSANHPISDGRLVEDLWEGSPPTGASSTLASHVSLLRQVIGRDRIDRRAGGYALVVDQWALDSFCFEREAEAGQRALGAGDARAAYTCSQGPWIGGADQLSSTWKE